MFLQILPVLLAVQQVLPAPEVTTTGGNIHGIIYEQQNVIGYLGIPYALPPLGDRRLEVFVFGLRKYKSDCRNF